MENSIPTCGKKYVFVMFIMKIKSNTTKKDLSRCFGLYQRPSSEENGTNSSSCSCHGSDVTWRFLMCI